MTAALEGLYRIDSGASELEILARAPGHDFTARGRALRGTLRFKASTLVELDVEALLAELKGADPIGTHELRKFVDADRSPIVKATLLEPSTLTAAGLGYRGIARVRFMSPKKVLDASVELSGSTERADGHLEASFSALGYAPPKLLFLKVKDHLDVRIHVRLRPE
ncbi:MAG: hypothetical protein HYV07_07540 [Deltaproteobacteria bacterium]|nr:hypothetical protein [Deltaproteobacteria bacterium]